MSKDTPESVARGMDWFLNCFEMFSALMDERSDKAMYVKTSDRIALFAIYHG